MKTVAVLSINYEPSEFILSQGHKLGESITWKHGRRVQPTGFGWAKETKPAYITITCQFKKTCREVRVDTAFRERGWERLTEKRVRAIQETCPNKVQLDEYETYSGNKGYVLNGDSADDWFRQAKKVKRLL